MAAATYLDVAVALGRPIATEEEQAQVEYWLAGIELFIKTRFGGLAHLDQDALRYVETEAVVGRVGRGRESSISVTLDDGSITRRYEGAKASDVSDEMWDLLSPGAESDAFTISPFRSRQGLVGDGDFGCWLL